ncbi:MAG: hypothetical protein DMG31_01630 [Acidobacteria bacterium]|nr:MAG: hypothetical protein DMG31_01630 [Acidobacteriota bacterium]
MSSPRPLLVGQQIAGVPQHSPKLRDILGATPLSTGGLFLVWALCADSVKLHVLNSVRRCLPMERAPRGYFRLLVEGGANCRYLYELGGNEKNET